MTPLHDCLSDDDDNDDDLSDDWGRLADLSTKPHLTPAEEAETEWLFHKLGGGRAH